MPRTSAPTPAYNASEAVRAARRAQKRDQSGADYGNQRKPLLPDAFTQKQRIADTRPANQRGQ